LFHLVVDAAEIFAEHADRDELYAAEKQHQRGERGEAGRRRLDLDEAFHDVIEAKTEAEEADGNSRVGQQP
jgi:DNA-binding GntR family transcriptional regulator